LLVPWKGTRIAAGLKNGGGDKVKNPLDSLWGTVISGLILTVILYNIVKFAMH
jgi:hypothetical protein